MNRIAGVDRLVAITTTKRITADIYCLVETGISAWQNAEGQI